jgi:hypothetical protein
MAEYLDDQQEDDGTDEGDDNLLPQFDRGIGAAVPDGVEDQTTDDGADQTHDDVSEKAEPVASDHEAGQEAGDEADEEPGKEVMTRYRRKSNNVHIIPLILRFCPSTRTDPMYPR